MNFLKENSLKVDISKYNYIIQIMSHSLSNISDRVMQKKGWPLSFAKKVEGEYRRFLQLHQKNPTTSLVPSETVDEMWHEHILHTRQYQTYCQDNFGHFFHHNPNDGGSTMDYNATEDLYRREFGEDPPADVWKATDICQSGFCNGTAGCSSGGCDGDA